MVRRAFFWSFLSQIANFLVQFATSVVMARLLSPREMGIYAIAGSVIGIVQLFTGFSVVTYIIREENLQPHTLDTAFTINGALSLALSLLIFIASLIVPAMLGEPKVGQVLALLALTPIFSIVSFRPGAMLQRAMQLRGVSLLNILSGVAASAVSISAALMGQSSLSPAYGVIAGGVLSTIGTLYIGREHVSVRVSFREWQRITAFGLRLMSIGGISAAASRVGELILAHLLGLAALGLYSRASNLNNLLFTNVYGAATRIVFPKLSEAQRNGDRVREVYIRGFRLIAGVMGPLLLGLAVVAGPMIHTLYGNRWIGAATPLSLLMLGQFITLSFAMNWELFVVRDDMKTQTRLEILRSLVGLLAQAAGSFINLTIASASSIFTAIFSMFLYRKHMVRLMDSSMDQLGQMYREVLMLSLAAASPAFLFMVASDWNPGVSLLPLLASVTVGFGLWAALVRWLDHPLVGEAKILLNNFGWSGMARPTF